MHLNTHFEQPSLKSWHALAKMEDDSSFVSKFVETDLGYEATLLEGFDYPTLKLFLLSILWRAGVSSRGEFRQVELGPHEEQLRRILLERNPGSVGDYTCLLFLMKQDFKGIHIPWLTRFEGRVGYRFLLGRVLLWFLATRGFESNRFIQAALTENGGWVAHMVERDGLPEFEAAARMAVSIEIPERLLRP
ncbi:MAG: hypothetical protein K8I65_15525 [Thermoanaerobaculia bacterium]|nr:hypothetical protein [Thermoanaerobaculia bacterium]